MSQQNRRTHPVYRAFGVAALFLFFCLTGVIIGASFFVSGDVQRNVSKLLRDAFGSREVVYVETPAAVQLDPEATAEALRAQEIAPILAWDFLNGAVPSELQAEEYAFLYSRVKGYWGERNPHAQILRALQRVHGAKALYPEITMLYALQRFSNEIPPGYVLEENVEGAAVATVRTSGETGRSRTDAAAVVREKSTLSLKESAEDILVVAERLYAEIETAYYAPIIAAQEEAAAIERARAEQIAANQEAARNRGMANNRAKADAMAADAAAREQDRAYRAQWSREQEARQRAAGIIR